MTVGRPKTFILQWLDAVAHADVPTAAKAVALAMATHADYGTGQNMRAGTARLAYMAGLKDRQTRSMIKALKDARLVTWDGVPTPPGKARNYTLTVPNTQPNGGSGVPPLPHKESPNGGSGVPPSHSETVAISDTNGGNNQHKQRQPTATHQGHTKARTERTLRGAPDGRAAARDNTSPLTDIAARLTVPELGPAQVTPATDATSTAIVKQFISADPYPFEFEVEVNIDGEPVAVRLDYAAGHKLKTTLIHWRDRYGLLGNVDDSELDEHNRMGQVYLFDTDVKRLLAALPDLVRIWQRSCQQPAPLDHGPTPLLVAINETACTTEALHHLRNLLARHKGSTPVHVNVTAAHASQQVTRTLQLPDDLNVTRSPELVHELEQLIGPACLS